MLPTPPVPAPKVKATMSLIDAAKKRVGTWTRCRGWWGRRRRTRQLNTETQEQLKLIIEDQLVRADLIVISGESGDE